MTEQSESDVGKNLPLPFQGSSALAPREPTPAYYPDDEEGLSLGLYLDVLLRRKWLLAAVTLTVIVLAALQVFTQTPVYRASARLQIEPEGAKVVPFQEVAGSEMAGGWFMENYLWTQTENLRSHGLATRVVRKANLAEDRGFSAEVHPGALVAVKGLLAELIALPFAGPSSSAPASGQDSQDSQLAWSLLSGVEAQPIRNTRLIEVSYTSPDPQLAARVVNTLAEEFIEQHLEGKFDASSRATDFLGRQLEELQVEVEKSERELLAYAQRNNIVNLSERETIARKRLADLSDQLTEADAALIEAQALADAAAAVSPDKFPESLRNDSIRRLEQLISEARSRLAGYASRYGSEWPAVKETRLEIQELESQLAAEYQGAIASAGQDYELARARKSHLKQAVDEQRSIVDDLNERSIQYDILQREVDSNRELYEGLLQRMKEAGVAAGLRSSNIRVAERAEPPRAKAAPRRGRTLAMASLLGLFLGTALVFIVETLDNTLKSSDDVTAQLSFPALGMVPNLDPASEGRRRLGSLLSRNPSTQPALLALRENRIEPRALEAYRSLRTALLLSHSERPPQVMLVTSAVPGEGKTTTAVNTAVTLAQTGARTLVVDLDLRKPSLAEALGVEAEQGMSTFLTGNSDLSSQIHETDLANLYLVSAGPKAPNPAELIGSQKMETGIDLLREYFAYIVIDSPPMLELSDALVLSRHTDGVILVARAHRTPRKAVQRAGEQLIRFGARFLGVLLNDVRTDGAGYGYYGSFGSQYHRSYPESDSTQRTA